MTTAAKVTVREAVTQVLSPHPRKARKAKEIGVEAAAIATGLVKSKDPVRHVMGFLALEAQKDDGLVVRTAPGTFKLNPKAKSLRPAPEQEKVAA